MTRILSAAFFVALICNAMECRMQATQFDDNVGTSVDDGSRMAHAQVSDGAKSGSFVQFICQNKALAGGIATGALALAGGIGYGIYFFGFKESENEKLMRRVAVERVLSFAMKKIDAASPDWISTVTEEFQPLFKARNAKGIPLRDGERHIAGELILMYPDILPEQMTDAAPDKVKQVLAKLVENSKIVGLVGKVMRAQKDFYKVMHKRAEMDKNRHAWETISAALGENKQLLPVLEEMQKNGKEAIDELAKEVKAAFEAMVNNDKREEFKKLNVQLTGDQIVGLIARAMLDFYAYAEKLDAENTKTIGKIPASGVKLPQKFAI